MEWIRVRERQTCSVEGAGDAMACKGKDLFLARMVNRWRREQNYPFECSGGRLLVTVVRTLDFVGRSCR